MFRVKEVKEEYKPDFNSKVIDAKPEVVEKGQPIHTLGAGACIVICIIGSKGAKEYVGIAHVLNDENEVGTLISKFDKISKVCVLGGTDDWFSKPMYDELVLKLEDKFGKDNVTKVFNPTKSDPNKVIDVYIDQNADCCYHVRTIPAIDYDIFSLRPR